MYAATLIVLFSALTLIAPEYANDALTGAKLWTFNWFDWLFAILPVVVLAVCLYLAVSPFGRTRLGGANAEPDFSMASWIAMLFAAGVGVGFLFYGPTEPLAYYTNWFGMPLGAEPNSDEARRLAFSATLFHWGIAPWGIYAVMGLAIGFFAYNRRLPLAIRSIFYPIFGERIWGWPGHFIDLFAVISTVFGLATTIGLGATQAEVGLARILAFETGIGIQVFIIGAISCLAIVSVVLGISRGVKALSNINMLLAFLLLVFVVSAGPTAAIFYGFGEHLLNYIADLPRLTNWIGRTDIPWFHDWTIFYWAWWVAWSPFVGVFIACISRGRTVREYLSGVIFIPFLVCVVWFTAFGETATIQYEQGIGELADGIESAPITLFQMLQALPLYEVTSLVAMVLLLIFIVTSADSGALVLETITNGNEQSSSRNWRVFWVLMIGITSTALLYGGGSAALQALQSATIVAAVPFVFLVLGGCISLVLASKDGR